VPWLVNHLRWTIPGAAVLLILGILLSRAVLSVIPFVLVLFLLFFASLMALVGPRGRQRPPRGH
jgi:hypothetical protein